MFCRTPGKRGRALGRAGQLGQARSFIMVGPETGSTEPLLSSPRKNPSDIGRDQRAEGAGAFDIV